MSGRDFLAAHHVRRPGRAVELLQVEQVAVAADASGAARHDVGVAVENVDDVVAEVERLLRVLPVERPDVHLHAFGDDGRAAALVAERAPQPRRVSARLHVFEHRVRERAVVLRGAVILVRADVDDAAAEDFSLLARGLEVFVHDALHVFQRLVAVGALAALRVGRGRGVEHRGALDVVLLVHAAAVHQVGARLDEAHRVPGNVDFGNDAHAVALGGLLQRDEVFLRIEIIRAREPGHLGFEAECGRRGGHDFVERALLVLGGRVFAAGNLRVVVQPDEVVVQVQLQVVELVERHRARDVRDGLLRRRLAPDVVGKSAQRVLRVVRGVPARERGLRAFFAAHGVLEALQQRLRRPVRADGSDAGDDDAVARHGELIAFLAEPRVRAELEHDRARGGLFLRDFELHAREREKVPAEIVHVLGEERVLLHQRGIAPERDARIELELARLALPFLNRGNDRRLARARVARGKKHRQRARVLSVLVTDGHEAGLVRKRKTHRAVRRDELLEVRREDFRALGVLGHERRERRAALELGGGDDDVRLFVRSRARGNALREGGHADRRERRARERERGKHKKVIFAHDFDSNFVLLRGNSARTFTCARRDQLNPRAYFAPPKRQTFFPRVAGTRKSFCRGGSDKV